MGTIIRSENTQRKNAVLLFFTVSLLVPTILILPTALISVVISGLVQYAVMMKNALQCFVNNPMATVVPVVAVLAFLYMCVGVGVLVVLTKQLHALQAAEDDKNRQAVVTKHKIMMMSVSACFLLNVILLSHHVTTNFNLSCIIAFVQVVEGILMLVVGGASFPSKIYPSPTGPYPQTRSCSE